MPMVQFYICIWYQKNDKIECVKWEIKKLLIKIRHKSNKKDLDFLDFSLHIFGLEIVYIYIRSTNRYVAIIIVVADTSCIYINLMALW